MHEALKGMFNCSGLQIWSFLFLHVGTEVMWAQLWPQVLFFKLLPSVIASHTQQCAITNCRPYDSLWLSQPFDQLFLFLLQMPLNVKLHFLFVSIFSTTSRSALGPSVMPPPTVLPFFLHALGQPDPKLYWVQFSLMTFLWVKVAHDGGTLWVRRDFPSIQITENPVKWFISTGETTGNMGSLKEYCSGQSL